MFLRRYCVTALLLLLLFVPSHVIIKPSTTDLNASTVIILHDTTQGGVEELIVNLENMLRAAQNLGENPLAAEMYGQRLLSASQTADTAAMARLNHEVYAQRARDGVRGIRHRQRPNGKVDWSKRKLARPNKA